MESTHLNRICAVDGGGTGCRAAIATADGTVIAQASGGPANYSTDAVMAVNNVFDTIQSAAKQIDLDPPEIQALVAHVGLAGVMSGTDAREIAEQLPFHISNVTDDRETSVLGALGLGNGALIAIGTGTFAASRRGGQTRFFGGWGLNVGDQASGARLGRDLLELTLQICDGLEPESELSRSILSRFDNSPAKITAFAASAHPKDYAEFAPQIIEAANGGDALGVLLMQRGADYINAVLGTIDLSQDEVVCLIGGVGPHYERYLRSEYRNRMHPPKGVALDGALQLARRTLKEMESSS